MPRCQRAGACHAIDSFQYSLLFRSLLLFRCLARQRPTHLFNLPLAIIWEDAGSNVSGTGVEQIAERHHDGRDNGLRTYFRSTTEHVLFWVRGRLLTRMRNVGTHFTAPKTHHSAKPDVFYQMVEQTSYPPFLDVSLESEGRVGLFGETDSPRRPNLKTKAAAGFGLALDGQIWISIWRRHHDPHAPLVENNRG
jgi:hypothetical protein